MEFAGTFGERGGEFGITLEILRLGARERERDRRTETGQRPTLGTARVWRPVVSPAAESLLADARASGGIA